MSNIIYGIQQIQNEEDEDIFIDSNDLLELKISEYAAEMKRKAEEAERKAREEYLNQPVLDEEGNPLLDEEGNPVLMADTMPEDVFFEDEEEEHFDPEEMLEQINAQAAEILAQAEEQAEAILAQAQIEADALRKNAQIEGERDGYNEGLTRGSAEMSEAKRRLDEERIALQNKYEEKVLTIEEELVDVISEVVAKVFKIQFTGKKEIILHIVENTIANIEGSKQFIIKVNEKNFELLQSEKASLIERLGTGIMIDIVLDPLMGDTDCVIETDGGLFDCSLDVQLNNLVNDIKSLSLI